MSRCTVVTSSGMQVYAGRWTDCYLYIMQALAKGSEPGFLRIIGKEDEDDVLGEASAGVPGHGEEAAR